jgi:selenide,water dikinase
VVCEDGSSIPYDVLSLDVGSRPRIEGVEGVERHAVVLRPLEPFVAAWQRLVAVADGATSITLVGGGAAGVELAFAMGQALRTARGPHAPHVRVVADTSEILPEWPAVARRAARRRLEIAAIGVHTGDRVVAVSRGEVRLASGITYATDAVFWTAGSAAPEWLRDSGLATDERGFVLTDEMLRSTSHPQVFAAGDCAVQRGHPVPRAGVFAVRAGPPLAHNLRAALAGQPLQPHVPRSRYLALLSTGERHAIGAWGPLGFHGRWAWRWKDRIDRRWAARYREPFAPG